MNNLKKYIESVCGTPYRWWMEGPTGTEAPFYADNGPLPSLEVVRANGLNCAGLINLLRRHQGLTVPGVEEGLPNAGGTKVWFEYLQERGLLRPFAPNGYYPEGSLLIRNYSTVFDQGHVAITMGMNRIAHCYPDDPNPVADVFVSPGVMIEPMNLSMSWDSKGFYTHWVPPEDWLNLSDKTPSQTE